MSDDEAEEIEEEEGIYLGVLGKGRYVFPHLNCQQTGEYLATPASTEEKAPDDAEGKLIPRWKASQIEKLSDEARIFKGDLGGGEQAIAQPTA
ncbi:hypothetical protein FGIG_11991 [Fasciola gigantica]|uniref:Uncharacterized protein n=1 Tax=Fasciola gigantica TaxID=46835 RepID=A0A504Z2U2_FASGI|nr:hypothetical protein FGIG_11991 [Fasciola gigantica]